MDSALPAPEIPQASTEPDAPPSDVTQPTVVEPEPVDVAAAEGPVGTVPPVDVPLPEATPPPPVSDARSALPPFTAPETDAALPILVVINSEPEGADLFVNGEYRGTTPTLVEFDSVGVFQIRLTLAGHDDVLTRFDTREWGVGEGGFEDVVSVTIPMTGTH